MTGFTLICCILNPGSATKALRHARDFGVKGGTIHYGMGTIRSRLLDALHINEVQKEILNMIIEDELASAAIKGISDAMHLEKPNHGIAFSLSVSTFIGSRNKIAVEQKPSEVKKSMYKAIFTVVDRGKAEDVITAANAAGAKGGTIIKARGAGVHEAQRVFGFEIEPEKEEVLIIAASDVADAIVTAIRTKMRIDEPGTGIIYVLDVNEVYGIRD